MKKIQFPVPAHVAIIWGCSSSFLCRAEYMNGSISVPATSATVFTTYTPTELLKGGYWKLKAIIQAAMATEYKEMRTRLSKVNFRFFHMG